MSPVRPSCEGCGSTSWSGASRPPRPILLLHGGNQSAHSWDLVSLHLADRYHVFALDQRGHGDSEWSRDLDYSVEAKAADALAFIERPGLGSRSSSATPWAAA